MKDSTDLLSNLKKPRKRRPNVFDVGPTLYKCYDFIYTVYSVMQMLCVCLVRAPRHFIFLLTPTGSLMESPDVVEFLREAVRMRTFDHPNVLELKGISLDENLMPMVILPFMEGGDLRAFVKDNFDVS